MVPKLLRSLLVCPIIAAISGAAIAQVAPAVPDAALERLAAVESRLPFRLNSLVYNDAGMRSEIKRIGFEKGCRAVRDSQRDVSAGYVPKLVPATVAAIRQVVPAERLNDMRMLSFVVGPLQIYKGRVDAALEATAGPILQSAYDAMRASFMARMKVIPTERHHAANDVAPRADVAAAVGITGAYDLDNPAQLGLACAELLISPGARPKISTTPQLTPFVVVPNP